MKRRPLKRGKQLRRRPWRTVAQGDRELRDAFTRAVLERAGYRCARAGAGGCAGQLDAHHVIPKAAIKAHARTKHWSSSVTRAVVWNPENGLCLCRRHHDLHERAIDRVPRDLIPSTAIAFAQGI